MFSDSGVNLVFDHILHDPFTRSNSFEVLADYPILFVGVHCPVEEIERRERSRGDRVVGQGRRQMEFVHKKMVYDVKVDTHRASVEACVEWMIECLNKGGFPDGWVKTRAGD